MRRILDPLEQMGARTLEIREGGRLPAVVQGARDPMPIEYEAPVPSAQLKSAVLLAGLAAPGATTVIEKEATRDHTEKMLKHFGASLRVTTIGEHGRRITLAGPAGARSRARRGAGRSVVGGVPAGRGADRAGLRDRARRRDAQSAAHRPLHDAARDGRLDRSRSSSATRAARTSPICAIKAGALKGVDVPAERAPTMIDEYPILAVAAAFAEGVTRMRGLKELRVKESDRLEATAAMLRANGVEVEIEGDDLIVHGKGRAAGGGVVTTHMDHRIAMSALVMGLGSEQGGLGRRRGLHRHELSGLRRPDARRSARTIHDHRHRRTGRLGQGHARQAARRALRLAPSRHRAALPRGGEGAARCRA